MKALDESGPGSLSFTCQRIERAGDEDVDVTPVSGEAAADHEPRVRLELHHDGVTDELHEGLRGHVAEGALVILLGLRLAFEAIKRADEP